MNPVDMVFITEWGNIAGFAGLTLGTFLFLFYIVIGKNIFPLLAKKQAYRIIFIFLFLVWSLSILSIVLYYLNQSKPMQLTVFIKDEKGNVPFENEGEIHITLGNRDLNRPVGENGRTTYTDITRTYKGDSIKVGLKMEGWEIYGNNNFVFTGKPINITVRRDKDLGLVTGIVKNRNGKTPLVGASVLINTDTTIFTNAQGIFKIVLPERMWVKSFSEQYAITVSKKGYESTTAFCNPKVICEIRLDTE